MSSIARFRFLGVTVLALLSACDALTGNKEKSISLSFDDTAVSVGQGARDSIEITVNRSNFEGPVTFSVEGTLPPGVTATFSPNPVQSGVTKTKLRVQATSQANPANATITVVAKGEGIADKGQDIGVTITVTGSYTLSLLNPSVTVATDGAAETIALLTRTEGNASSVQLTATGAPSGLSVSVETPSTGRGAGVAVSATGSVAPGTYPITITSQAAGITPDQTTQLSVVVIAPPSTTSITVPFCTAPNWFAFRNEGGTWQRVQPTGTSFTFAASQRLTIAYTQDFGAGVRTNVFFVTRDGLLGQTDRDCDGSKSLNGSIINMTSGQTALVGLGANGATTTSGSFNIQGVATRPLDLVAVRGTISAGNLTSDKVIIRRSQDYSSTIPELDFNGAEAFAPATNNLTVSGFETGFNIDFQNLLWSATSTFVPVSSGTVPGGSTTFQSVPAAQLVAGDLHELLVDSYSSDGRAGQALYKYFTTPADQALTVGPPLTIPLVSVPTTTPYARLRAQLASQAEYPDAVVFFFLQGASPNPIREVLFIGSANHFGGRPATWEFLYPDLSNVAGFNASWAPAAGQPIAFYGEAFAAREELLFGAVPSLGETLRLAYRVSQTSTLLRAAPPLAARSQRRPLFPGQYFRR